MLSHCPFSSVFTLTIIFLVVDGGWSEYGEFSEWSACSVTCEKGTQSREQSRTCTNPEPEFGGKYCVGDATNVEIRSCDMKKCPGNYISNVF